MQAPEWLKLGSLIDVKGNDNSWKVGIVLKLEEENALINFDGWSTYSSTFPVFSKRLAPFRRYTLKYTGMPTTKRNWTLTEEELSKMEKRVEKRLTKSLFCKNSFKTTQFYRGEFFIFIENLIEFDYKDCLSALDRIVNFFTLSMNLIIRLLNSYSSLFPYYYKGLEDSELFLTDNNVALANTWPEILDTLNKLLAMEPRCRRFFLIYQNFPIDYQFSAKTLKNENYSGSFIYLLNLFANLNGFEITVDIVKDCNEDCKVPINFLSALVLYPLKRLVDEKFFNEFAESLSLAVVERIKIVSDKDIKHVEPETIVSLLQNLKTEQATVSNKIVDYSLMLLYIKMVKSNYMEKRIKGLNEICNYLDGLEKNSLTDNEIFQLLDKENLMVEILETRVHAEILKRANQVLKLFAKNGKISIKESAIIWNFSQDNQKMVSEAGFSIIIEISPWLDLSLVDFFYEKLISFPENLLNLQAITDFSINILEKSTEKRVYGADCLLKLISDVSESGRWVESAKHLIKLYSVPQAQSLKHEFLKSLPVQLNSLDSIPQYLNITLGLLKSFSKEEIIETCRNENIKEQIIKNSLLYIKTIRKSKSEVKQQTVIGKFTHYEHIRWRIAILEFIFNKTCFEIFLTLSELKKLWNGLVKRPGCSKDPNVFFKSIKSGLEYGPLINNYSEVFENLFLSDKLFVDEDVTVLGFKAFKFFFFKANHLSLDFVDYKFRMVKSSNIVGIEKIVNIFLEGDSRVVENALKLIKSLITFYSPEIASQASEVLNNYLEIFLDRSSTKDSTKVLRVFDFFIKLLDLSPNDSPKQKFYVINGTNFIEIPLPLQTTVRFIRKTVATHFSYPLSKVCIKIGDLVYSYTSDNKKIKLSKEKHLSLISLDFDVFEFEEASTILANNKNVMKFVFSNALDDECKEKAWFFLSKLPEKVKIQNTLENNTQEVKYFNSESTIKFLYSLCTVKLMSENQEWLLNFKKGDGPRLLTKKYISLKNDKKGLVLIPKQEEILIEVLNKVGIYDNLAKKCLKSLFLTLNNVTPLSDQLENPNFFGIQIDNVIAYYLSNFESILIKVCQSLLPATIEKLMPHIINGSGNPVFLTKLVHSLIKIIKTSKTTDEVLKILQKNKQTAIKTCKTPHYWRLFYTICGNEGISTTIIKDLIQEILLDVSTMFESSAFEKNLALYGLLKVIKACTIHTSHPNTSINSLVLDLLLGVPNETNSDSPRCKHRETREAAYEYILSIFSQNPSEFLEFLNHLNTNFHLQIVWRNCKYKNWHILMNVSEKSKLGYVGLRNPGCVCYMNSLFQQLFHIRSFSNTLLQLQQKSSDTVLSEVKNIFSLLKYSNSPYVSPKKFCKNFKDFDGKAVNVFEQMDVDEFFGRLMERTEEELKGSSESFLIQNHFGGVHAVEMISECKHKKERLEHMLSLPLDVKNKKSLTESLNSLVHGEVLQGENAYFCEVCEKKLSTVMRTSLKHLPNFLVFALRRFEFNFDTMTRNKIDDFFEFPLEINMKQYTTEYLNELQTFADDYYDYKLKGVVIHHGRAEQGHYYSYIHKDNKWIEFNDTNVTVVDLDTVTNNGFGQTGSPKSIPTAYLLIYERETKYHYNNPTKVLDVSIDHIQEFIDYEKINKKNNHYWIKKFALSPDYLHFYCCMLQMDKNYSIFILQFFLTILIRVDRVYDEKLSFFKYLSQNMDKNTAVFLFDTLTSLNGIKEFLLFCPNPLSRKLLVLLAKSGIRFIDEKTLQSYFLQYLRLCKYATRSHSYYCAHYIELLVCFSENLKDFTKEKGLVNLVIKLVLGYYEDFPFENNPDANHLGYIKDYETITSRHSDSYGNSYASALRFLGDFYKDIVNEFLEYTISQPGYEAFLNILDSKSSIRAYAKMYANLLSDKLENSINFVCYLLTKHLENSSETRYLVICSLFMSKHSQRLEIVKNIIDFYTEHIPAKTPLETKVLVSYLFKFIKHIPYSDIAEYFSDTKIEVIKNWLFENIKYKINEESYDNPIIKKYYEKIACIKENTSFDEIDSDDELPDSYFEKGASIHVFDSGRKIWLKGTVLDSVNKELIMIEYTFNGSYNKVLKDINYDEVYPG